jgi:CHASE2 domain-containing sensor protein
MRAPIQRLLIGEPFWNLWGGRIVATVIMSAIVAWTLQLFETGMREFVDTTVQNTLLQRLGEPDYAPPRCDKTQERQNQMLGCISVIGIDDTDFRGVFQQRSPLNPDELRKLFDTLRPAPPRVVAVDLDLSPASVDDWPARERLLDSLLALSKVTQLVMVCPQGYSTTEPGPLDKAWVQRFGTEVHFASPDLSVDGLYYDRAKTLPTLGVVGASVASNKTHPPQTPVDWDQACRTMRESSDVTPDLHMIRPAPVEVSNFTSAVTQPESFADRIVLIGGKWGINDQFHLRGQTEPHYGVSLHAWVMATELAQPRQLSEASELVLDVVIGMLAGGIFFVIWRQIGLNWDHYGKRSLYYALFFVVAFGLPVLWVVAAAHLAKLGVVLGAAGMILSAAADSFLSSHETLLEASRKTPDDTTPEATSETWWQTARVPLLVTLVSVGLLATLFEYGHMGWVCLVCGSVTGAFFGTLDHRQKLGVALAGPESLGDLAMRLTWTVLKAAALVWWAMGDGFDWPTGALLASFMACWMLTYKGWFQAGLAR